MHTTSLIHLSLLAVLTAQPTFASPTHFPPQHQQQILFTPPLHHAIHFTQHTHSHKCTILSSRPSQPLSTTNGIRRRAAVREVAVAGHVDRHDERTGEDVVEVVRPTEEEAWEVVTRVCKGGIVNDAHDGAKARAKAKARREDADTEGMEVFEIIKNGPSENRIDVVFMGDGYTPSEKPKFLSDIRRLTSDMWGAQTFASVLPLFNIWAVFAPSNDSGIGVGGKPKDTPFGLYRDGTELRGIYCSKPNEARKACTLTGPAACDYPSLIANDDYYGGLGGEFVISTRSNISGTVVLRHEMGHNLVEVGEEYDGGQVYSGVNSEPADRPLSELKWAHWFTDPDNIAEQKSVVRVQDYAWYDLSHGAYTLNFSSDGTYARWGLKISASGVDVDDAMRVSVDGVGLEWRGVGHLDRSFFDWTGEKGFEKGDHTLTFALGIPAPPGAPIRQLCSVQLIEYAAEPAFHMDNSYISAYPTISQSGTKTYRPTNEGCLMRNMGLPIFCSVCKEGLWTSLLSRLHLIDTITTTCPGPGAPLITVTPLPLAQFRPGGDRGRDVERFAVRWYTRPAPSRLARQAVGGAGQIGNGTTEAWRRVRELDDLFVGTVHPGMWRVEVEFRSVEVRSEGGVMEGRWEGRVEGC